jgi:hypothetical protein
VFYCLPASLATEFACMCCCCVFLNVVLITSVASRRNSCWIYGCMPSRPNSLCRQKQQEAQRCVRYFLSLITSFIYFLFVICRCFSFLFLLNYLCVLFVVSRESLFYTHSRTGNSALEFVHIFWSINVVSPYTCTQHVVSLLTFKMYHKFTASHDNDDKDDTRKCEKGKRARFTTHDARFFGEKNMYDTASRSRVKEDRDTEPSWSWSTNPREFRTKRRVHIIICESDENKKIYYCIIYCVVKTEHRKDEKVPSVVVQIFLA